MTSGTTFEPGSVVLIPYPYSDLSTSKKRPVLVVSGPDRFGDFVGLAITSNPFHDHAIEISPTDMATGSLPKVCWVRTDKLFTLESSMVAQQLGLLDPTTNQAILDGVCGHLGCNH